MKTRPDVTDDEIRSFMNFDGLLSQQKQKVVQRRATRIYLMSAGIAIVALLIVGSVLFISDSSSENKVGLKEQSQQIEKVEQEEVEKSKIDSIVDREEGKLQRDKNVRSSEAANKRVIADKTEGKPADKQRDVQENPVTEKDPVYIQAEPVNGFPSLYEYFQRELKYPEEALKDSVQGVVSAIFTISAEGKPEKISVEQSLGDAFDRECVRLINDMPAWKPATYNGKPVPSRISLPLTFRIQKIKTQ